MGDDGRVRVPMGEDTHERLKAYKKDHEDWDGCMERLLDELSEAAKEIERLHQADGVQLGEGYEEMAEKLGEAMGREDTARRVVEQIREELGLEGDVDVAGVVAERVGPFPTVEDVRNAAETGAARAIEDAQGGPY